MGTVNYERLVAEYESQPSCGPEGHEHLLRYVQPRAHVLYQELTIVRDPSTDPYSNSAQLAEDVFSGVLRLGPTPGDNGEHPYWTQHDFFDYRTWHDIEGHHVLSAGFDRFGELTVLRSHIKALHSARRRLTKEQADLAVCAVFNEVFYRVACGIICGDEVPPHQPVVMGTYGASITEAMLAW